MELITFSKSLIDSPEIISLLILSHSKVRNPKYTISNVLYLHVGMKNKKT